MRPRGEHLHHPVRRQHGALLPAGHLAEIGARKINPARGLIEQFEVLLSVTFGAVPWQHPRPKAVGDLRPSDI